MSAGHGGIRTDDLFNETMLRISARNIPTRNIFYSCFFFLSFFFSTKWKIDRSRDDFPISDILRTVENESLSRQSEFDRREMRVRERESDLGRREILQRSRIIKKENLIQSNIIINSIDRRTKVKQN